MKVAITTSSFARYNNEPLKLLQERGIEYVLNDTGRTLSEDETVHLLQGCVGVAAGTEPLCRRVLEALPELKVISRCGVGMDNVDQQYAADHGIAVCSTPDAPTEAVAELTVGFMLTLMRQIPQQDRDMRQGIWKKRMGNLLSGKRVGIIGFGRIGQRVAKLLEPFDVEIAYSDLHCCDPAYPRLGLDNLMDWADIITLHCAKTEGGPLLDKGRLSLMRPGSYVINTARGGLIDLKALYGLLMAGHLGGAALDVYPKEPYTGSLKEMENVILTPHSGSYACESRVIMELDTIKNLLEALDKVQKKTSAPN